ncbi:MAG: MarR family transcriptional regulator [bacterium]
MALPSELAHFVEEMALRYEDEGFPPMAGRLAGWLLVCEPSWQTAAELAEVLDASPASISTMTRMLIRCGLIERVAIPGQRVNGFRIKPGAAQSVMSGWLAKTTRMRQLLEHGLELVEGDPNDRSDRLREQLEFHRFIEQALPPLLERWECREEHGCTPEQ